MPVISVVVPIYKVELYLHKCIDSIIAQTYDNLEIILVDDGSPDSCGKICDDYSRQDCRIVVLHKKNEKTSAARNAGIDIVSGEYLIFVDGDDWIESDMIEFLYKNLINNNAGISACSRYNSYLDLDIPKHNKEEFFLLDSKQAIVQCFETGKPSVSACCKLYKKSIFKDVRFPVNKSCEDIFIIADTFLNAGTIVYNTIPKYHHRQRKSSITKCDGGFNPNIIDMIEAYEYNLKIIENKRPEIAYVAKAKVLDANLKVLQRLLLKSNCWQILEYKKTLAVVRNNFTFFIKCKDYNVKVKILLIALKINVRLYKTLILMINNKKNKQKGYRILFD